jgi:hypothetical protein
MECRACPKWPGIALILEVVFGFFAVYLVLDDSEALRAVGWAGIAVLGPSMLLLLWQMGKPRPVALRIDDEGVEYAPFGAGAIPWSDIRAVRRARAGTVHFLSLELHDDARHRTAASAAGRKRIATNEQLGLPPFSIGFSELVPNLEEVWDHLLAHHADAVESD